MRPGMYDVEAYRDGKRQIRTVPTENLYVLIRGIRESLISEGYDFSGSIKDDYYAVRQNEVIRITITPA